MKNITSLRFKKKQKTKIKKQKNKTKQKWIRKEQNLKMTASMKVKAGVRLLTADARVGELYSIPIYPHN